MYAYIYNENITKSLKNKYVITIHTYIRICDWLWENPPVTLKDNYLEKCS